MRQKKEFIRLVLNHLIDRGEISDWEVAGNDNRHDYTISFPNGKVCCLETKGCLDGNNTNIFARPPHADEFVIWSICSNPGSDPQHIVWSGIHTRLSAEIIERKERVDGVVVWDWICGTVGRLCPKIVKNPQRITNLGIFHVPPPCIYLFPSTIPSPRNNPQPNPQNITSIMFLDALHRNFEGYDSELNNVYFSVGYSGTELVRTTKIVRDKKVVRESTPTPIRRT